MPNSLRAEQFIDSIGVNINMRGFNTAAGTTELAAALDYLGISHARVVATTNVVNAGPTLGALADDGISFDMLMPAGIAPASTIASLAGFAQAHPGAIMAIEGPNEINNFPISYNGLTGVGAGIAFVNAAATDIAATALAGVALYDLTGADRTPALSADAAGYVNIHPYPTNGAQPGLFLLQHAAHHMVAGKGLVITEAGYQTGPTINGWAGVDKTTQAKLTLNLLADATKLGVANTFLYDLKDYNVNGGNLVGDHLGLFDSSLVAKPVATAIHNLTSILADPGTHATSFAPAALAFTLGGLPASGNSLLLEKSNGVHDLLLWAEPQIWNPVTHTAITAPPSLVTISFPGPVDVTVDDPLVATSPIASYAGVTQIQVAITDHPLVVEITGGAPGGPRALATYSPPIWASGDAVTHSLIGGNGNDQLTGGPGGDVIFGSGGADLLTAGAGADLFVYKTLADSTVAASGQDQIIGFSHGRGDHIDLSALDADLLAAGGAGFHLGGSSFTHSAGELIQVKTGNNYLLEGDTHGFGVADFAIMLQNHSAALVASDFIF